MQARKTCIFTLRNSKFRYNNRFNDDIFGTGDGRMLNRVLIVWIVFAGVMGFVVGGSFVAEYQIPLSRHETSADPDQRASNQNAKEKITEHNTKAEPLWVPTDSVGLYTLVLAVFTGLLVGVSAGQGYFLLRADKTARIAANAAELSARAAIAIELPIITAEPDGFGWGQRRIGDQLAISSFDIDRIIFFNAGRTKAIPLDLLFGYTVGDQLPEEPIYVFSKPFSIDCLIETDPFSKLLREYTFDVAPGVYSELRIPTTKLWFYCKLVYLDFMQMRHEVGFCWRRLEGFGGSTFVRDETPAYNYRA